MSSKDLGFDETPETTEDGFFGGSEAPHDETSHSSVDGETHHEEETTEPSAPPAKKKGLFSKPAVKYGAIAGVVVIAALAGVLVLSMKQQQAAQALAAAAAEADAQAAMSTPATHTPPAQPVGLQPQPPLMAVAPGAPGAMSAPPPPPVSLPSAGGVDKPAGMPSQAGMPAPVLVQPLQPTTQSIPSVGMGQSSTGGVEGRVSTIEKRLDNIERSLVMLVNRTATNPNASTPKVRVAKTSEIAPVKLSAVTDAASKKKAEVVWVDAEPKKPSSNGKTDPNKVSVTSLDEKVVAPQPEPIVLFVKGISDDVCWIENANTGVLSVYRAGEKLPDGSTLSSINPVSLKVVTTSGELSWK